MSAEFTISIAQEHIEAHMKGDIDTNITVQMWKHVIDDCTRYGRNRVLVTCSRSNPSPPQDEFEFISHFAELDKIRKYRIAWVELNSCNIEQAQFVETMLRNRGIHTHVFLTVQDARSWLLK